MLEAPDISVIRFDGPPQIQEQVESSWVARGANFVVRLSRALEGCQLVRLDQADEYFVLLPDTGAWFETDDERLWADRGSLVIVPPGRSTIRVEGQGLVVSIFSGRAQDLAARAVNADVYAARTFSAIAPLTDWPMPKDGYRLRIYHLEQFRRPDTLMRLFRTRNLMINVFCPREMPRDIRKLSPHSHSDFEQGSLSLAGRWIHHLRYPWTPDMTSWRDDRAVEVASPSLTIIPPPWIHTSRNLDDRSWLIDIFAPVRQDFSRRPGLVNNADQYPMPDEIAALGALTAAD